MTALDSQTGGNTQNPDILEERLIAMASATVSRLHVVSSGKNEETMKKTAKPTKKSPLSALDHETVKKTVKPRPISELLAQLDDYFDINLEMPFVLWTKYPELQQIVPYPCGCNATPTDALSVLHHLRMGHINRINAGDDDRDWAHPHELASWLERALDYHHAMKTLDFDTGDDLSWPFDIKAVTLNRGHGSRREEIGCLKADTRELGEERVSVGLTIDLGDGSIAELTIHKDRLESLLQHVPLDVTFRDQHGNKIMETHTYESAALRAPKRSRNSARKAAKNAA